MNTINDEMKTKVEGNHTSLLRRKVNGGHFVCIPKHMIFIHLDISRNRTERHTSICEIIKIVYTKQHSAETNNFNDKKFFHITFFFTILH